MTSMTIATMILVLGFVWGGFLLILGTAVRKEREKGHMPDGGPGG